MIEIDDTLEESAAVAKLRDHYRAQRDERKRRAQDSSAAAANATANAYVIYTAYHRGEKPHPHDYIDRNHHEFKQFVEIIRIGTAAAHYRIQSADLTAYGTQIEGIKLSPSGLNVQAAVFADNNGNRLSYALGVHQTAVSVMPLPGIPPEYITG